MGIFSSPFVAAVEKATSELLPSGSEDLEANLEVCELIQSKKVSVKEALQAMKKRLGHKNPNVHLLTFHLLDICAKNGGSHFISELASHSFVDYLASYIRSPTCHSKVREKALECFQIWGIGFASNPGWRYMSSVYETLKREGYAFPPPPNISADYFETQTPPEWGDSDVCMKCRTAFTLTNRKHHCRNCGQTFCGACSSQNRPLLNLGLTEPVRVCDGCVEKVDGPLKSGKVAVATTNGASSELRGNSTPYSSAGALYKTSVSRSPKKVTSTEDEELQMVLQLSLEEMTNRTSKMKSVDNTSLEMEEDPLLAAAIAESLKETKQTSTYSDTIFQSSASVPDTRPSAPMSLSPGPSNMQPLASGGMVSPSSVAGLEITMSRPLPNYEKEQIRKFASLLREAESGGQSIRERPDIKELYREIYTSQARVQRDVDEVRLHYHTYNDLLKDLTTALKKYDQAIEAFQSGSRQTSLNFASVQSYEKSDSNRETVAQHSWPLGDTHTAVNQSYSTTIASVHPGNSLSEQSYQTIPYQGRSHTSTSEAEARWSNQWRPVSSSPPASIPNSQVGQYYSAPNVTMAQPSHILPSNGTPSQRMLPQQAEATMNPSYQHFGTWNPTASMPSASYSMNQQTSIPYHQNPPVVTTSYPSSFVPQYANGNVTPQNASSYTTYDKQPNMTSGTPSVVPSGSFGYVPQANSNVAPVEEEKPLIEF